MSQVRRAPFTKVEDAIFEMLDRETRIAVIRMVEVGNPKHRLWRSMTFSNKPEQRTLVGYFPGTQQGFELAVGLTWATYVKFHPPTSNRR